MTYPWRISAYRILEDSMLEVKFYDDADDRLLKFAVIVSKHNGKWVFCKHKKRDTYECPGGHREEGENIAAAAKRELYEETGALEYTLEPICIYSVKNAGDTSADAETFGMLFYADIIRFGELPDLEIERIELFEDLPEQWTYEEIQPVLMSKVNSVLTDKGRDLWDTI